VNKLREAEVLIAPIPLADRPKASFADLAEDDALISLAKFVDGMAEQPQRQLPPKNRACIAVRL